MFFSDVNNGVKLGHPIQRDRDRHIAHHIVRVIQAVVSDRYQPMTTLRHWFYAAAPVFVGFENGIEDD